ncbi:pseudaminic acid biosynthesis-associated methylase [Magnetovibrio blakemorei]|uniref:Methyltransferase type 11 domain-containing protein n=1 Tax=Magnetovibrio blakemorei TaxID=28181 RepID=A0A1E5Q6B3_9PROT|nr:pseudaminic acid biosynthesis-associated methylase [Magnetovibrio blakemorei]OEJ66326.1 hypothetical protein BEN30_12290 [Magnetovibrio blakemorei]
MNANKQLDAWRGSFGDEYTKRNVADNASLHPRIRMWTRILKPLIGDEPSNILEVGANLGLNMRALRTISAAKLTAVEPNPTARQQLINDGVLTNEDVHDATADALPFADNTFDLAFTSGVMIHIAPENLGQACDEIHRVSSKYIMCCEYYSDKEEAISYRGQDGLLFKRDYGDFWLNRHTDLILMDYGFFWKKATGLDNLTWWLFKKG